MVHWTPTGIEPTDYNDDDDVYVCKVSRNAFLPMHIVCVSATVCLSVCMNSCT